MSKRLMFFALSMAFLLALSGCGREEKRKLEAEGELVLATAARGEAKRSLLAEFPEYCTLLQGELLV